MEKCFKCGAPLKNDDVALHKKMINRDAKTFMCPKCIAKFYDCDVALIEKKREQFIKNGCLLFEANKKYSRFYKEEQSI